MKTKHIYAIDFAVIVGSLLLLIIVVGYASPLIIAPVNNLETTNDSVLFLIEKADLILIDDNVEFTSPDEISIKDGMVIRLKPGIYYWKAVGVLESKIRTLTINSEVDLRIEKVGEDYGLVNAGNVNLHIEVYNGTELVDNKKLGVGEKREISGTKFIGEWDE